MAYQLQLRTDTAANWTSANPILSQGEPGYEVDTGKLKVGDGVTAWNSLAYYTAGDVNSVTASSPLASSGGANPNLSLTGTVGITNGGTGQTSASAAFNALSPITTTGDLVIGTGVNTSSRLAIGSNTFVLTSNGTTASWQAATGSSGANTALSNLASVAVNTSLLPTSNNSISLGSAALQWQNIYAATAILTPLIEGEASGGTLSVTGGTAAAGGNGGQVTVAGASGTATGGNGGAANLNGGNANSSGGGQGGAVAINGGQSFGTNTGGTVTLTCGTGGPGTTAGATGGTINVNGGTGGAGSSTSGNGGGATLKAGSGGGGVTAGTGGTAQIVGGTGGTGSASGGNGGAVNVTGGSPGNFAGANGGAVTIASSAGTNTTTGGAGGSVTISTGQGNGDNTTNQAGGSLTMSVGHSAGSAGGANITMTAGAGGVGTSTTGANGGNTSINAGNGGAGSGTGGTGGNVIVAAGAGGNSGSPGAGGYISLQPAATTSAAEVVRVTSSNVNIVNAPISIATAGFGLDIKGGSNCKLGTAVLSGGTVTVANTSVTTNSRIFLTSQADGGSPGFLRITAKTAATSFVITSSNASDTSTVAWMIVESL